MVPGRESALPGQDGDDQEDSHTDDHVESVKPRQSEIQVEEHLHMRRIGTGPLEVRAGEEMVLEFGAVFDVLDPQEDRAEDDGGQNPRHDRLAALGLGGPHGHGHGQAAADQDGRIDRPQRDVQLMAAQSKGVGVCQAVHHVGREDTAEEHDLGGQEDPHTEERGVSLLLVAVEVVL